MKGKSLPPRPHSYDDNNQKQRGEDCSFFPRLWDSREGFLILALAIKDKNAQERGLKKFSSHVFRSVSPTWSEAERFYKFLLPRFPINVPGRGPRQEGFCEVSPTCDGTKLSETKVSGPR